MHLDTGPGPESQAIALVIRSTSNQYQPCAIELFVASPHPTESRCRCRNEYASCLSYPHVSSESTSYFPHKARGRPGKAPCPPNPPSSLGPLSPFNPLKPCPHWKIHIRLSWAGRSPPSANPILSGHSTSCPKHPLLNGARIPSTKGARGLTSPRRDPSPHSFSLGPPAKWIPLTQRGCDHGVHSRRSAP